MKAKLFIGLMFIYSITLAQLNEYDSDGKKDGRWVVLLNEHWKEVPDTLHAQFFRYTYYDHGTDIYPMGNYNKNSKLELPKKQSANEIQVLDGTYKWFNKNGVLMAEHILNDGEYVKYTEYYSNGKVHQIFDYNKHFQNRPLSYGIYIYDKKGQVTVAVMTKGKKGWLFYPASADDLK